MSFKKAFCLLLAVCLFAAQNGSAFGRAAAEENGERERFEFNLTPIHGQSVAMAITHAAPPLHTEPVQGGFMFGSGVLQSDDPAENMTEIVPLAEGKDTWLEQRYIGAPQVENSAWGTSEMIARLSQSRPDSQLPEQFYSTCGQDGTNIFTQFDTELDVVRDIFTRVRALVPDRKAGVPAVYWIQGEADNTDNIPSEEYKKTLREGLSRISAMAGEIFGQKEDVRCITYQTAWAYYDDRDHFTASQAQMELCRDEEYFAPSCPAYILLEGPNDLIHLSNWGQYLLGLYQGIQFDAWIVQGKKNVGVMPLRDGVRAEENRIVIRFAVECPPLRFSDDWVALRDHYGFEVIRDGQDILTGAELLGEDSVVLTCSDNVRPGDTVYYAMQPIRYANHLTGRGGNLCDSQGDRLTAVIDGTEVALNNYCYAFKETIR